MCCSVVPLQHAIRNSSLSGGFNLQCPGEGAQPAHSASFSSTARVLFLFHCSNRVTFIQYVDLGRNNSGSNMKNFGAPPPLTQMKKKKPNTVLESVIWSIDGFLICCKYFPLVFNCIVCVPLHMSIRELFSRHRQTIFISRSFLQPTRN